MALAKHSSHTQNQAASIRELKHRVLTCLKKLSDRDIHSIAVTELESIAKTLTRDSIPPFISSISAIDATDKSPVRKQCVRLISLLSETHGDALSPYLSKILSAVVRRLRDPDSAVRSACVDASGSISSHITKPPFTSIIKPLIDALVTKQDQNSQIGAALCIASAIDASPDPEPLYLKKLLPRLEKLLKCESFKGKPALLTLIASIIGAGGATSHQILKNLVPYLVEFVSHEDWAARKAAAEALTKLAVVEKDMLSEFKYACLKTFEVKRFDKVKLVRETMNQMVDAWTEIPDVSDDVWTSPQSQSSSKENASDGHYPPDLKTSCTTTSGAPQMRRQSIPAGRSLVYDDSVTTIVRKRRPLASNDKKTGPAMFRKLDHKKPIDWKIEIAASHAPATTVVCEDDPIGRERKGEKEKTRLLEPELKQGLFNKNADDRMHKFGGSKAGSRVVPCHDETSDSTVVVNKVTEDLYWNQKESEDLSLIRKQLVQIENQQASLLDLFQKFIGSSQNGMHSLETRVHGLELALDEISFDLATSTGRISNTESKGTTCFKLPGAEFLSSKFWRRTEGRCLTSRFSSSAGTPSVAAMHNIANENGNAETFKLENRRFQLQGGGGGFVVNPLAEIHRDSRRISEVSSNTVSKNVHDAV